MNQTSSKLSFYSVAALLVVALGVWGVMSWQSKISASSEGDEFITKSIPFKVGDNEVNLDRSLDLSGRIIGLNGSLITIEEAKQRGIIEGVYNSKGQELDAKDLLSPNSSFIIKVKDISSSPALFF